MVYVKPETGGVGAGIPARGRKAALEALYREFFRHFNPGDKLNMAVMHTVAQEEVETLMELIRREFSPQVLITGLASPVLGVHVGLKAIAILGYTS